MYARSPPLSRYRRRSSATNYGLLDEEHNHHPHLLPLLNRQHCRCCSMSSSDLLSPSPASFDHLEHRQSDAVQEGQQPTSDWRSFEEDESKMDSHNPLARGRDRRPSRTSSIVSTLSSPNILLLGADYQPAITADNGSRLRERLAASVAGLKELDILREKHRRMVDEVKTQLKLNSSEMAHARHQTTVDGYSNGQSAAPRSPSPAELSSNISHRSSVSMDSGVCLSLTSDPASASANGYRPMASAYYPANAHQHQRRLSTDSANGFHHSYLSPIRKTSWTMSSASALYDSLANAGSSDDEGCYPAGQGQDGTVDSPRSYNSLASITAALAAAEASVAAPRSVNGSAPLRYRRRLDGAANGSGAAMAPSRPRSLYNCYPEENTVTVDAPVSPRQVLPQPQPQPSNMRLLRRTSIQYRPQVPTIVANLPESISNIHADLSYDSNTIICRRRPAGGRSSAVDPVFRASRVFIDTLPENETLLNSYLLQTDDYRNNVALRPRRYETRRPRPTSVAVPPSVSTPVLSPQHHSAASSPPSASVLKKQNSVEYDHDWRRVGSSSSFTWEEAKRLLDPAFATRSSSSSTLVRQHSTASATSNGCSARPSPKVSNRRRHSKSPVLQNGNSKRVDNPGVINVSVVTTGDVSSASSSCGAASDGCNSDGSNVLVVNGTTYSHSVQTSDDLDHKSISRSISSQSSDSNKSRRNKEKMWRESADL